MPIWKIILISVGIPVIVGITLFLVYLGVYNEILKERNQLREGRARVPDSAIENMYYNFSEPTIEELEK